MERNFTDESFEHFLQQNADGLRMRPSADVWEGISKQLYKRKRRLGFLFGISLLTTTVLGYIISNHSHPINEHSFSFLNSKNGQDQIAGNLLLKNNRPDHSTVRLIQGEELRKQERIFAIGTSFSGNRMEAPVLHPSAPEEIVSTSLSSASAFSPTIVDYYSETEQNKAPETDVKEESRTNEQLPLSIESVINSFKPSYKKHRVGLQVYFTPTISYRKLGENKSYLRSLPPSGVSYTNPALYSINSVVTHKPDFGFELGLTTKYTVNQKMKVKGGIQFNVSRYDIKAFNTSYQLATIALNTGNGIQALNTVTTYNNFNGYHSDWLQNFYVQVSAPVGVEFKLRGDDKVQFGVGTTIQPTYVLGDRAFLISTDYKNYTQIPSLTRRWNANASVETFVSYSTGHLNWQVGPQVRYQLLSSFINKYPVKENLFDFGLKVGISLNKH
jgi:hypothetical protein